MKTQTHTATGELIELELSVAGQKIKGKATCSTSEGDYEWSVNYSFWRVDEPYLSFYLNKVPSNKSLYSGNHEIYQPAKNAVMELLNGPVCAKLVNKAKIQKYAHKIVGTKNSLNRMRAKLNSLPLRIQKLEDELEENIEKAERFKMGIQ